MSYRAHNGISERGVMSGRSPTETGSVSSHEAVLAMHLSIHSVMMEVALTILRERSNISTGID